MGAFVRLPLVFAVCGLAAVLAGGRPLAQSAESAPSSDSAERRLAAATIDALQPMPASAAEQPEEVVVRGRKSLARYRLAMERARDDIVKIYNEANSNDDNDVTCRDERPTGSRIPQRVCRSNYENRAEATAARAFLHALFESAGNFQGARGPTGPPPGGAQVNALVGTGNAQGDAAGKAAISRAQLEEEMERLLKENERLYRAVVKYVELKDDYDRAREDSTQ